MGPSQWARLLVTCGNGEGGKLGLKTFGSTTLFTLCRGLLDVQVAGVSCGNGHTAVVTQCGTVFSFGQNEAHQLGHSSDLTETPVPREVEIPERIVSVSAGGAFTLALTEDGALYGWGDNRFGQTGTGDRAKSIKHPVMIQDIPRIASMAAGANHALAVSEDGEVLVWGANGSGQLGLERKGMMSWFQQPAMRSPRINRSLLPSHTGSIATEVSAGSGHSLVATETAGLFGLGSNKWWQLGVERTENFTLPQPVPGSATFRVPACGATVSAALDATGALHLWGTDTGYHGAIPEGLEQQLRAPTAVPGGAFRAVALGFAAGAAITRHGRLATWGWAGYVQEGTWLERAHGIGDDGSQLGHGTTANAKKVSLVQNIDFSSPGGGPGSRLVPHGGIEGTQWCVESVACGLDHMAAVIAAPEEVIGR